MIFLSVHDLRPVSTTRVVETGLYVCMTSLVSRDVIQVSRAEYVDCNVYDDSQTVMMLNCSNPRHRKRFTILFEPFQSIPNVPEYHAGGTYYFISQYI